MPLPRVVLLTTLTMVAFAGNSLLCRVALRDTTIDATSFTGIRLVSGALVLWLVVQVSLLREARVNTDRVTQAGKGTWLSALALFSYAACFSFAYLSLSAATGALLLFGSVQATMIGFGLWSGERLGWRQSLGLGVALAGLVVLFLPGLSAPPVLGALLMVASGIAWGIYSLHGRGAGNPTQVTAGNFLRGTLFAIPLCMIFYGRLQWDVMGVLYAVASGALASGLGYALWYAVLPSLKATNAATVQLSVPVIAALGGALFLGEALTLQLALASVAILGGIGLVIVGRK